MSIKKKTNKLFIWFYSLANFGGTVGLCTGFSLLSLAEILYFFSLRIFNDRERTNEKKMKRKKKMISKSA